MRFYARLCSILVFALVFFIPKSSLYAQPSSTEFQDVLFEHALSLFREAERAQGTQANLLYDRFLVEMQEVLRSNRTHSSALLALFYTGLAFQRTSRPNRAIEIYTRIIEDYSNNTSGSNEVRLQRTNILEYSAFRLAIQLERVFDYDQAIRYYTMVISQPTWSVAQDYQQHRHDALASIAVIRTNLASNAADYAMARQAWRNFLPYTYEQRERALAQFRIAEMSYRAQDWPNAVRSLQEFRRSVPLSPDTAEFQVEAQYFIANALRLNRDTVGAARELRAVATLFTQTGSGPGTRAAVYAAEALFRDLDTRLTAYMTRRFTRGTVAQVRTQLELFRRELQLDVATEQVFALLGGEWSMAALVRNGEAHEYLADAIAQIPNFINPPAQAQERIRSVQRNIEALERQAQQIQTREPLRAAELLDQAQQLRDNLAQDLQAMLPDRGEVFRQESNAQRKIAIRRYAFAVHLARSTNISTRFTVQALEHLQSANLVNLLDVAIAEIPVAQRTQLRFNYTPGMFNIGSPGIAQLQDSLISTPGLTP